MDQLLSLGIRAATFMARKALKLDEYDKSRKNVVSTLNSYGIKNPNTKIVDGIANGKIKVAPYDYSKSYNNPNYSPTVQAYKGVETRNNIILAGILGVGLLGALFAPKDK